MLFSSTSFVFAFLPAVLALYAITPARFRNVTILVMSLLFYSVGPGALPVLLVFYIIWNWFLGLQIEKSAGNARPLLIIALMGDLGGLIYFKYAGFLWSTASSVLAHLGIGLPVVGFPSDIPLGISFFTFQAMSYVVDIYARRVKPTHSLVEFATFKSFFPQLIAGPIVRYAEVRGDLQKRSFSIENLFEGSFRFSLGLGKKILIADPLATITNGILTTPPAELTGALVWLAMLAYSFQIYFDFSGYSDMAIGLARMFGFHFPENFNCPYQAHSITEFWRRWHMTLSRWFRDYVYIPLGGNRGGGWTTARNLLIVFTLCGLWHGAAFQFLVWGLYHGALLSIERATGVARRTPLRVAITFVLVLIGWVFFRAQSLTQSFELLSFMSGLHQAGSPYKTLSFYLTADKLVVFAVAALFAFVPMPATDAKSAVSTGARGLFATLLLVAAAAAMSANQFSPFIYFQF